MLYSQVSSTCTALYLAAAATLDVLLPPYDLVSALNDLHVMGTASRNQLGDKHSAQAWP